MKTLYKSIDLSGAELKSDVETGRFTGYASVFNGVDSYKDTILSGAYANVLQGDTPKMFFNHNAGGLPVGKWLSLKEDEKGLFVEGELTRGNPEAEAVLAALQHGTVDGLSIGYAIKPGDYEEKPDGGRIIKNISRLYEISIVTFPADNAARVESVKSEDVNEIKTIRDFENFLREAGGFSKSAALALCAKAKALAECQRDSDSDVKAQQEIADRLRRINERLSHN